VLVELHAIPDCPNLVPARQLLYSCLSELGLPVAVTESIGDYPSPSILINGVDVMGGVSDGPAVCRLDLPTPERVHAVAAISSTDPHTGEPIHIAVAGDRAEFSPPTTVVVYAATTTAGPSVATCCSTISFFAAPANGQRWIAEHPDLTATVLDQTDALALGREIFGPLLATDEPTPTKEPL
jgi:hypothetical protein